MLNERQGAAIRLGLLTGDAFPIAKMFLLIHR
jgi:hypothetical protein